MRQYSYKTKITIFIFAMLLGPYGGDASAGDATSYLPPAMTRISSVPVGTIIAWPVNSMPLDGTWVECDGKNATPDLRGRFIRGLGGKSGALGQVQLEETKEHMHTIPRHSHTVTGTAAGQSYRDYHQEDRIGDGYRGDGGRPVVFASSAEGTVYGTLYGHTTMSTTGGGTITGIANTAGSDTDKTGGVETRPENVALKYIMKIR